MTQRIKNIPRATIQRLSVYLQVLENLQLNNVELISSEPLAKACEVNASQIRKDLTYFGEFGVRGVGYTVDSLILSIKESLGIQNTWNCILMGAGNLGRALLRHKDFRQRGFHIVAVFDNDPKKIGQELHGLTILSDQDVQKHVQNLQASIAIITTPSSGAQKAAQYCIDAGIKGIMNYAPGRITVPEGVYVEYVDFFHHLYSLAFHITKK